MVVIVDYGMGNLGSIRNMLKKLGAPVTVSGDPVVIAQATQLILPGVGAFCTGMQRLSNLNLASALNDQVRNKRTPTLGVCLGMQLMTRHSEEGDVEGLGWINARTVRFRVNDPAVKVPHMGWNTVTAKGTCPLLRGFDEEPRFYFVHSYHLVCDDPALTAGTTCHGYEFASVIQQGNIFGVQFHPEKSHTFGLRLLKNFLEIDRSC